VQLHKQDGHVTVYSRNGSDFTRRYPMIEQALHSLPAKSFVIDGELVARDAQGRPDFAALHRAQCWHCRNHQLPRSDLFQKPGGPRCLHSWQHKTLCLLGVIQLPPC